MLPFTLGLSFLLILLPSSAFAAYEIICYGNGEFIAEVMNSIAILAGGGDLNGLLKLGLIIGLLVAVLGAMFQRVPSHAWFIGSVIIYMVFFGTKVDVAIEDKLNPAVNRVIGNVPAGAGLFAWGTNQIGIGLTKIMETAFAIPGVLKYESNGYLMGADLMRRSTAFIIPEPHIRRSFVSFIRNCTFYDLLDGYKSENQILKTSNLLNEIATNSTRSAEIYTSSSCDEVAGVGELMLCKDAYPRLNNCINSYYPQWRDSLEKAMFGSTTGTLETLLGTSYSYLANITFSAKDTIIQNALINTFGDSFKAQAAATGADATLLAIAVAEAEAQQKSAFVVIGEMAKKTLPVIRGVMQGMLYGIFPIVMFLMMTPLIGRIFPAYLTILLWVEFWNPIYAIVNLFGNLAMSRAIPGVVEGELSIITNPALAHETELAVAVAGLATMIVPFIAYFIVSQSQHAIVGAVQQFLGPTSGLSQSAGSSTALGNVSLGNASLGNASYSNISANKDDTTSVVARGDVWRYSGYGGGPAYEMNVGNFPLRITGQTGMNTEIGERVSELRSSALSNVSRSAESLAAQVSQLEKVGDNYSQVKNLRTGETISLTGEQAESLGRVNSIADKIQKGTGVDRKTAVTYALAELGAKELGLSGGLSAGTGGGSGFGLSGNIKGGVKGSTQYKEGFTDDNSLSKSTQKVIDSAERSDYSNVLGITDRFGKSTDLSTSTQNGTYGGSEKSAGITEARSFFNEASSQLQQAQRLEQSLRRTASGGVNTSVNLTPELASNLVKELGSFEAVAIGYSAYSDYLINGKDSVAAQRFQGALNSIREGASDKFYPTVVPGISNFNIDKFEGIRNGLEAIELKQPQSRDPVRQFGEEGLKSTNGNGVALPETLDVDKNISNIKEVTQVGRGNIQEDRGKLRGEFVDEKSKAQGEVLDFQPTLNRATFNATLGADPEHSKRINEVVSDPQAPLVYKKEVETPGGGKKEVILGIKSQEEKLESLDNKVIVPEEYRDRGKE